MNRMSVKSIVTNRNAVIASLLLPLGVLPLLAKPAAAEIASPKAGVTIIADAARDYNRDYDRDYDRDRNYNRSDWYRNRNIPSQVRRELVRQEEAQREYLEHHDWDRNRDWDQNRDSGQVWVPGYWQETSYGSHRLWVPGHWENR